MDFGYWEPGSVQEAISLLACSENGALPMAGGTDLLVKMKRSLLQNKGIVNLKRIPELKKFYFDGRTLSLGALTNVSFLVENPVVQTYFPLLATAARGLGTPQIRNLATIGGNLCNASPAADLAVAAMVYGARFKVEGLDGERTVEAREFFKGPGQTVVQQGELLTAIEIDTPPENARGALVKFGRRKSHEIALVSVAVLLSPNSNGRELDNAKIALGAVGPTPLRAWEAEESLAGKEACPDLWAAAAELAVKAASPIDDVRSTAVYRRHMVKVLTQRTLQRAWEGDND